jgi:hypothetical protein
LSWQLNNNNTDMEVSAGDKVIAAEYR